MKIKEYLKVTLIIVAIIGGILALGGIGMLIGMDENNREHDRHWHPTVIPTQNGNLVF